MWKTVTQQTYERYVIWANSERKLAEKYQSAGDNGFAKFHTERANDFARQATDTMRDLARMG